MFNVSDIGVLYNSEYLGKADDSYVWNEKQNNPNALAKVEFVFKGGVICFIKSGLLDKMKNAYRINDSSALMLRKICDGLLFLDRGEEHYFVVLEIKSRFGDVKNIAINQIPASYVKAKSILNDFLSYNKSDYKEFGLIVSYPYMPLSNTDSEKNPVVMEYKKKMTEDKNEIITSKYNTMLRDNLSAVFLGSDFEFDKMTQVKQDLFFDKLKVKHYPVPNHCVNAVIDLDDVIETL